MLPNETRRTWYAINIKEFYWFRRMDADSLIHWDVPIIIVPVDTQKPTVFRIGNGQFMAVILHVTMSHDHIVCDREDLACLS